MLFSANLPAVDIFGVLAQAGMHIVVINIPKDNQVKAKDFLILSIPLYVLKNMESEVELKPKRILVSIRSYKPIHTKI
jgi:hypothetical protein